MKKIGEIRQEVLHYLQSIPSGKVSTYKLLAKKFDTHPRTIAAIMKYNDDPITFPCYKVVAQSGDISGYNTKKGVSEKIHKLTSEGIEIKNNTIENKYFWI